MSADDPGRPSVSAEACRFATTHWSLVVAAREPDSPEAREALSQLCRAYWYPLYAFIRRQGHTADQAQDLTQEFFARLLEHRFLGQVDRDRGRFRAFLLAACKHFLANEYDRAHAQKRGGGRAAVSLDLAGAEGRYRLEPSHDGTADNRGPPPAAALPGIAARGDRPHGGRPGRDRRGDPPAVRRPGLLKKCRPSCNLSGVLLL
jgi:DNA-directed RNA polymerase specialized sigma24 family protein